MVTQVTKGTVSCVTAHMVTSEGHACVEAK